MAHMHPTCAVSDVERVFQSRRNFSSAQQITPLDLITISMQLD
jgi:hypothetical protein